MAANSIRVPRDSEDRSASGLGRLEAGWKSSGFLPDPEKTFTAVFAERVADSPGTVAFCDVTFEQYRPRAVPHTFGEVAKSLGYAAIELARARVAQGDRVVVCLANPLEFLSYFLAAQALGAIPVPLPAPSDFRAPAAFRERTGGVVTDCEPRVVVVDSQQALECLGPDMLASIEIVDASAVVRRAEAKPPPMSFERSFLETAFIQYTSGSTGSPKGVVVTHSNLVANMRASTEAAGFGPHDRSLSWLPLYHDMGLVGGMLLGIYLGIATYVMPPRSFVGRPDSWLRAISEFKATFSCAPNFAYNILAHRLPDSALASLDLSSWRLAFNGSEPVDRATVEAFTRRFAPAGLPPTSVFPVYGMAECTLAVSFSTPGAAAREDFVDRDVIAREGRAVPVSVHSARAVCFTSVGRAVPGHHVRILEPKGTTELPERQLGEVVVSGPSVTPFYFRKDGRNAAPRNELRTGDLGYVAEGELYIVDRIKDLLIIGGKNLVPSDVERVVSGIPGVRYSSVVAFSMPGAEGTEELYLVVGAERGAASADELSYLVSTRVYEHFGVAARDIVVVKPSIIPRTSSGKLRRAACRELYESGGYRYRGGFRVSSKPPRS